MNFWIKWSIVFSLMLFITGLTFFAFEFKQRMQTTILPSAMAMTFEEAYPLTFYNVDTMTVINESEMERLITRTEFDEYIAIDPRWENTTIEIYGIKVSWERQNSQKDRCSVGKVLEDHPEILRKFPGLKQYEVHCPHGGGGHGGIIDIPQIS